MKTITIKIVKKSVMGVVEGLSATIAQHNPEVDFQTVWASDAEEAKLDIYYREAITDLENFLAVYFPRVIYFCSALVSSRTIGFGT